MALTPDVSQQLELIVQQFKESPYFSPNDIFDVAFGHGMAPLQRACMMDDGGIDGMEASLLNWYSTVYLDKFYSDPSFANDVLNKMVELGVL
ncbi:MAG: hypothetical protein QNJ64_04390 [Crocosphaera sp.]|nr:hypothetical protein [Crocosphaera sp.]